MKAFLKTVLHRLFVLAVLLIVVFGISTSLSNLWVRHDGHLLAAAWELAYSVTGTLLAWTVLLFVLGLPAALWLRLQYRRMNRQFPERQTAEQFKQDGRLWLELTPSHLFLYRSDPPDIIALEGLSQLELGQEKGLVYLRTGYDNGQGFRYWFTEGFTDWQPIAEYLRDALPDRCPGLAVTLAPASEG